MGDRVQFFTRHHGHTSSKWWGRDGGNAYCLSTDQGDGEGFQGKIPSKKCYRTLKFAANGKAYSYDDQSWTPGRRNLEGGVPTAEDVTACEMDGARDDKECEALVGQILDDYERHPENLVEIVDDLTVSVGCETLGCPRHPGLAGMHCTA